MLLYIASFAIVFYCWGITFIGMFVFLIVQYFYDKKKYGCSRYESIDSIRERKRRREREKIREERRRAREEAERQAGGGDDHV